MDYSAIIVVVVDRNRTRPLAGIHFFNWQVIYFVAFCMRISIFISRRCRTSVLIRISLNAVSRSVERSSYE